MEIPKNACTQYPSTALPQMRAAGRSPALRTKRTAERAQPAEQGEKALICKDVQILIVRRIDPSTAYNVSGFVVPLKIRRNTAGQRIRAAAEQRSLLYCLPDVFPDIDPAGSKIVLRAAMQKRVRFTEHSGQSRKQEYREERRKQDTSNDDCRCAALFFVQRQRKRQNKITM